MRRFTRFAGIDWSGARGERQRGIAVAWCEAGDAAPVLIGSARGWSRQAVLDWLLDQAGEDLLVGVDFSAALPFADRGAYLPGLPDPPADARALWAHVEAACAAAGDPHLEAGGFLRAPGIARHFREGAVTGAGFASGDPACRNGRLRRVEREPASGRPASSFNLVGASQVGKSSLTGMRLLHRLERRVPVWPFDPVPARGALLVELYTSLAARDAGRPGHRAKMRSPEELGAALASPAIGSAPFAGSAPDEHGCDAILAAAWLRRAAGREALWSPAGLAAEPGLAATEGWTFGVP